MQCYMEPQKRYLTNTRPCKTCAKLVLGKSKYDSASQTLQQLHWLPIQERIQHKILTLTHKISTGIPKEPHRNQRQA